MNLIVPTVKSLEKEAVAPVFIRMFNLCQSLKVRSLQLDEESED